MAAYEYRFVRLGAGRSSAFFGVADAARKPETYQAVVHQHAVEGWRLVQICAPSVTVFGAAKYYESIFDREVRAADATP
jgi:hypothetical protein